MVLFVCLLRCRTLLPDRRECTTLLLGSMSVPCCYVQGRLQAVWLCYMLCDDIVIHT